MIVKQMFPDRFYYPITNPSSMALSSGCDPSNLPRFFIQQLYAIWFLCLPYLVTVSSVPQTELTVSIIPYRNLHFDLTQKIA